MTSMVTRIQFVVGREKPTRGRSSTEASKLVGREGAGIGPGAGTPRLLENCGADLVAASVHRHTSAVAEAVGEG